MWEEGEKELKRVALGILAPDSVRGTKRGTAEKMRFHGSLIDLLLTLSKLL